VELQTAQFLPLKAFGNSLRSESRAPGLLPHALNGDST
jgi:hypothetical protein